MTDYVLQIVKAGEVFVWILFKDGKGEKHGAGASAETCLGDVLEELGPADRVLAQISVHGKDSN